MQAAVKRCFFLSLFFCFVFGLGRFLCLGWLTDHSPPPSLALFFSFVSFGIPSSPIFVLLKLSTFEFPPVHSFSLCFSCFLQLVPPPLALLIHLFPFFLLICSPFLASPFSVHRVHLWAACSDLNLLRANQQRCFPGFKVEWSPAGFVTREQQV